LTFQNGKAADGGGVFAAGNVTLTGCTFIGNAANNTGGGLYAGGDAYMAGCTFIGNTAKTSGGGIFIGGRATASDSIFTENEADFTGGGLHANGSVAVNSCTFAGNKTYMSSKGMYAYGGGGMFTDSRAAIDDCLFKDNVSGGDGGGVYTNKSATLNSCSFVNNTAAVDGGGVFIYGLAVLENCELFKNTARYGGGVFTIDAALKDCAVADNDSSGGTIYCLGHASAENSSFNSNRVYGNKDDGGVFDACDISLWHCTFTDNKSGGGGDVYNVWTYTNVFVAENCLMTWAGLTANSNIDPVSTSGNRIGNPDDTFSSWFGTKAVALGHAVPLRGVAEGAVLIPELAADAAGNTRSADNCLYGAVNRPA
jgi:predicted outer membrane repeat protein